MADQWIDPNALTRAEVDLIAAALEWHDWFSAMTTHVGMFIPENRLADAVDQYRRVHAEVDHG